MNKTYTAKPKDVKRQCYMVDAKDKILGRLATRVAILLRGKHKANYTPHIDGGDSVIIINAEKIRVTGNKLRDKVYRRYSGYPGGQKTVHLNTMLARRPVEVLRLAITRMLPSNPLGRKMARKLKIYVGEIHPHKAQKPISLEV